MEILDELTSILSGMSLPIKIGYFYGRIPTSYIILSPLPDQSVLYADDAPQIRVCAAKISLFAMDDFQQIGEEIAHLVVDADFVITERLYEGFDKESERQKYSISIVKEYFF